MGDISTEELKKEINAILKTADLSVISAKKVREQVEKKLNCSLVNRKKEIDSIVMEFIEEQNDDDGEDDDDDEVSDGGKSEEEEASASADDPSSDDDKKKKPKKRPQPTTRKAVPKKKKRKSLNASDSGSETDGGSDSDYEIPKKTAPKKKGASAGGAAGTTTARKSTGFTRPYNLSPELSAIMGSESLPRHEVVKKVWAIIKERNLYDPKNKQFAICDDELLKVMGVKRFRTFAMLKYLKPHFLN